MSSDAWRNRHSDRLKATIACATSHLEIIAQGVDIDFVNRYLPFTPPKVCVSLFVPRKNLAKFLSAVDALAEKNGVQINVSSVADDYFWCSGVVVVDQVQYYQGHGWLDKGKLLIEKDPASLIDSMNKLRAASRKERPPEPTTTAYYHVLVCKNASLVHEKLIFKDLSEQKLRTSFVAPFLSGFNTAAEPDILHPAVVRARIIRTARPHDEAVHEYLREWGEKAEEFMRLSGWPVNGQSQGDSAIAGAGMDVTIQFLQAQSTVSRKTEIDKIPVPLPACENEPKKLGHYDITGIVGKGAAGTVYAALDPASQRRVAIRTIRKSALDASSAKEYSAMFSREARAVARLTHPNIVQVLDFGEEGDFAYIVMEFIAGKELQSLVDANHRFNAEETVSIMRGLCEALHFAHEAGVIHRDVKPANVMIAAGGRAMLTDFGVAHFADEGSGASISETSAPLIGTPAYMSPEAITGEAIDRRTDIFSAGVILYQLLTGEMPFAGSGTWTTMKNVLEHDPPPPSSINKGRSFAFLFDKAVNKALAKKVDDRYQTALELDIALKAALGRYIEGRSGP